MIFLVFIPLTGIYAFLISIKLPLMIFYTPVGKAFFFLNDTATFSTRICYHDSLSQNCLKKYLLKLKIKTIDLLVKKKKTKLTMWKQKTSCPTPNKCLNRIGNQRSTICHLLIDDN